MSYIINKTDGTVLTEVIDGTVDQTATDLTLVGKNASRYGEAFNENFVHLLENFASTVQPNNPIQGQLWYDTNESRLKIYDGNGFKVSGGSIVSNTVPSSISQGDIWIDSRRKQLYFNDGVSTILAGPIYTSQQGITGFQVADITDINQNTRTIVSLYVGSVLLGIFSNTQFTPYIDTYPLLGWQGSDYDPLKTDYIKGDRVNYKPTPNAPPTLVYELVTNSVPAGELPTNVNYWRQLKLNPGFNPSTLYGLKFDTTATSADALVSSIDGSLKTVSSFLLADEDSSSIGTLTIANSRPLILGTGSQNEILVGNTLLEINSNKLDQDFRIGSLNGDGLKSSIYVNSNAETIGIYTETPDATLDVNGSVHVRGDLLVDGTTTTINSTELLVDDISITLGDTDTPTDALADGGGIILKGTTDKTFTWDQTIPGWSSSENLNLIDGNSYYIDSVAVLEYGSLGSTVIHSSLTRLGSLDYLNVGNLYFDGLGAEFAANAIVAVGDNPSYDIILIPKGIGSVDVSETKIINLANPDNDTDAVNLQTLNTNIRSAPLGLSADATGLTDSQIASDIIELVYPADEHELDTICRIWCINSSSVKHYEVKQSGPVKAWAWQYDGS